MIPEGAASTLQPGAVVGEYEITHLLGEGGMGVVYAGMHPEIGKRVAIKVLAPHAAQHPDLIRRFKEEARAVNKIRHPNIIDIFAFNQLPDGRHYFVMEYLDGASLTARLERGSMELTEMRRLLAQICSALEAAHEAGVVHRDLKPDNIWVATPHLSESSIKLLDFGIAKLNDLTNAKATQTGTSMGTPHYMAPEQAMGRAVDHRADVYALGVVLYQIFAGTLPFDGMTAHEIVFKHVSEAPALPSSHRPIVPAAVERIILDCLEKEPARRPASMRELSHRIEAAFAGGSRPGSSAATMIPRLPRAAPLRTLPPGGTELLRDWRQNPAVTLAQQPWLTPLEGSGGERMAPGMTADTIGRSGSGGRRTLRWAAGIGAAALLTIVVGVVVTGWRSPEPSREAEPPVASTARAATPVPPAPPPVKASAELGLPVRAPAPPAEPPAREAPPRPEHHRKAAGKPIFAQHTAAPGPEHATSPPQAAPKPAAKPNCNPNFYLDAQGDKHFKPECF